MSSVLALRRTDATRTSVWVVTHRLFIVDDHGGFREAAGALLHGASFDVVGMAASGEEALALLADRQPDVLLLDVELPDTTGFEICRVARAQWPRVRVVLCSVHPAADFSPQVDSCGAKGFLTKTQLSPEALLALLG